jgi:hypothetical protein
MIISTWHIVYRNLELSAYNLNAYTLCNCCFAKLKQSYVNTNTWKKYCCHIGSFVTTGYLVLFFPIEYPIARETYSIHDHIFLKGTLYAYSYSLLVRYTHEK